MKYGYCVNMIAADAYGVGYERIPALKRAGFDYVELPLAQLANMPEKEFSSGPLSAIKENELPCMSCNNFFPASHRLTGPAADHDRALSYAETALQRAALLGAERVVFGSAGARNAPLGFSLEQADEQLSDLLCRLGDIAGQYGITLVIEHLNIAESNLINSFSQGLTLAQKVRHPHVAVLADYYHLRLANEPIGDILVAADCLQHVHIARPLNRSLPMPGDSEDYRSLFSVFHQIGYDKTISIEAFMSEQSERDMAASLSYLRSLNG